VLVSQADIDSLLELRESTVSVSTEITESKSETEEEVLAQIESTPVDTAESSTVPVEPGQDDKIMNELESEEIHSVDTEMAWISRDVPETRMNRPAEWIPEKYNDSLSGGVATAFNDIKDIITGGGRRFIALLGPDGSRDVVLRNIYWNIWSEAGCAYVDLVQHEYPLTLGEKFPSVLIIDGMDHVADTESEEQARLLRDIGRAYSSSTPLIVGLSNTPKEVQSLSSGLKLTLGLARVVSIGDETGGDELSALDSVFSELVSDTTSWSENAFPGAGLESLMGAIQEAYQKGNRKEAVAKGCAAVARRLSHLSDAK
jgi:hypothetical protein